MLTYPAISPDYRSLGFWIKFQKETAKNGLAGAFKKAADYFERTADENRQSDFLFCPRSAE